MSLLARPRRQPRAVAAPGSILRREGAISLSPEIALSERSRVSRGPGAVQMHTTPRHIRGEGDVYGTTCSDHSDSWSWPGRGSIGILASSVVAMPPWNRAGHRG
jgi:hypothetical protein